MSWIIQTLLRNSEILKERHDLESDEYNDLLVIETKIAELQNLGFLSDMDICIIDMIAGGERVVTIEDSLGKSRSTISKSFIQICDRISYFLGGYFTDDGFLENMRVNHNLTDEDVAKLRIHMSSKDKHKLIRSPK
jgi:hypothetical protein